MEQNIIKPDWFDTWFSEKFPESCSDFTPKDIAFGFNLPPSSIYSKLNTGEIQNIRLSRRGGFRVPRNALYEFALQCYCLNY